MATIVFIHGMFVTPACWRPWQERAATRGHRTEAPSWPARDGTPAEVRARHPDPALAGLTLDALVEQHRALLRRLTERDGAPPLLIGHSMGGLLVQLLLQEGLATAGVAIDSAPPRGLISLRWSFLKANWPAISPFASVDKPILMDKNSFAYAFTNAQTPEIQARAWEEHVVPESRRVGKGPTTAVATIDYTRARPPLLLIAGERDHIIPASLNAANHARYKNPPSETELKTFPGRDHWLIAAPNWEEIADYAFDWLSRRASPA